MSEIKIAFLTRWNATCGVSMHAELLGREFIKMGYEVTIFAPTFKSANKWWHHRIIQEDEKFVVRCFEEESPSGKKGKIEFEEILSRDFDVLVVESYNSIPYQEVSRLISILKGKVKTVAVIHESEKSHVRYPDLDIFDAIVVFDNRYADMLDNPEKIHVIPYPCYPLVERKMKKIGDRVIFFSFGRQPPEEYNDYFHVLSDLRSRYDLVYRIIRSNGLIDIDEPWIEQWQERPTNEKLYEYLQNSDIHLLPKGSTSSVVVSSTIHQCLGSLCPIVTPDTRHYETLPEREGIRPVVLYTDRKDLKNKIVKLIEDEEYRTKVLKMAEEYVRENSSEIIAKRFLELFKKI